MTLKTRHCEECKFFRQSTCWPNKEASCAKGHRLRFYLPRYPMDLDCGYKRRCEDFVPTAPAAPSSSPR